MVGRTNIRWSPQCRNSLLTGHDDNEGPLLLHAALEDLADAAASRERRGGRRHSGRPRPDLRRNLLAALAAGCATSTGQSSAHRWVSFKVDGAIAK